MSKVMSDYVNSSSIMQQKMLEMLSYKLQLLSIKKYIKNANYLSKKGYEKIKMSTLVDLYNNTKDSNVREYLRNDRFFQLAFINCQIDIKEDDVKGYFLEEFDQIIQFINDYDLEKVNFSTLSFINRYSIRLVCSQKAVKHGQLGQLINIFFGQNEKRNYLVDEKLLNKINLSQLVTILKKCDIGSAQTLDNNLPFPNYLELNEFVNQRIKKSSFTDIINCINKDYYCNSQLILLLNRYFELVNIDDSLLIEITNYILKRSNTDIFNDNIIDISPKLYEKIKYKIKNLIKVKSEYFFKLLVDFPNIYFVIFTLENLKDRGRYHYFMAGRYFKDLNVEILLKLREKHVINIFNALDPRLYGDEPGYGLRFAINIYVVFGYNRALDILNGKYGEINKHFYDEISKIAIKNNCIDEAGNIKLNQNYINLFFDSEKDNNFVKVINSNDINFMSFIYNNYDDLVKEYGKLNLKKCRDLYEKTTGIFIAEKNNLLKNVDIYNNIVKGNRLNQSLTDVMNKIIENYELQQQRITSTIPYIEGQNEEYYYQTMRLNNPIVYNIGYLTNCCFRINEAVNDLKHATLDLNARILLIYNELKEIVAFSVLNRTGEVIIVTSIEYNDYNTTDKAKILSTFMKAINHLYYEMNLNDTIKLITIGANSKLKPKDLKPFPGSKYKFPRCSKNDTYQANSYHKTQYILLNNDDIDFSNLVYDDTEAIYKEPRLKIKRDVIDISNKENYLKLINRVNNKSNGISLNIGDIIVCNEDWYIVLDENKEISGNYLEFDDRAVREYESIYQELVKENKKDKILVKQ